MKTPKPPTEFDYDLWTTEDGKCMVRVKRTNEVCAVSKETFRVLRNEEKKIRRSATGAPTGAVDDDGEGKRKTVLSLNYVSIEGGEGEDLTPYWLIGPYNLAEEVSVSILEADFMKTLTVREQQVYHFCMKLGGSQHEFSKMTGLSTSHISKIIAAIRKKAKNFF